MRLVALNRRNVEEQINKNLKAILVDVKQYDTKVGIIGGTVNTDAEAKYKKPQEVDVAYYAAENEFGVYSKGIPSRPFLRTTFEGERREKISRKAQSILKECAENNRNTLGYLTKLGLYAAGEVRANITQGDFEGNSEITILRKGSSRPLIDTGTMRRYVTAWVTKA